MDSLNRFFVLLIFCFLSSSVFAQSWVAKVNKRIDTKIRKGQFAFVLDGANLTDTKNGFNRIGAAPKFRHIHKKGKKGQLDKDGDQHTLAFSSVKNVLLSNCILRANEVEEALKFSRSTQVVVDNCVIYGGSEDAVDIVRGSRFVFRNVTFIARGNQAVTIKGGVRGVDFINCRFEGKPRAGHFIELGNWSRYDILERPETGKIRIDNRTTFANGRSDERPQAVHVMHAAAPEMKGQAVVMPRFMLNSFFRFKRLTETNSVMKKVSKSELCWGLKNCPLDE